MTIQLFRQAATTLFPLILPTIPALIQPAQAQCTPTQQFELLPSDGAAGDTAIASSTAIGVAP